MLHAVVHLSLAPFCSSLFTTPSSSSIGGTIGNLLEIGGLGRANFARIEEAARHGKHCYDAIKPFP
jgi:hypothetical protein